MALVINVKRELEEVGAITLYFFVGSLLILLQLELFLADYDITFPALTKALVGALVVAKVIVILESRAFMEVFRNYPGYVNVLYKTGVYIAGVFVVLALERIFDAYREVGALGQAIRHMIETRDLHHILAITLLLVLLIGWFNCWQELCRIIGKERLFATFFPIRTKR